MKVREVVRTGPVARWMARHEWGAVTLPWPGGALILYWVAKDENIAWHEWHVHVPQIERMGGLRYLASWLGWFAWLSVKLRSFTRAYLEHPMEQDP